MRIDLSLEREHQVIQIASQAGRNVDEVAGEMFTRFLTEEARFIAAVKLGEAELDRVDFLTHEEVGARVNRSLPQRPE